MKRKFRKIMYALMFVTMIIFIIGNFALASGVTVVDNIDFQEDSNLWGTIGAKIDGVTGILTMAIRIPFLMLFSALHLIMTGIAMLSGTNNLQGLLTPDDIFFNQVKFTDINFFKFDTGAGAIDTIRLNVATWYYVLRILAMVILLAILIYVGIRMAITSVASDQAKYKEMLIDWAVSFALLFLLNYIIMFAIEANDALVELLRQPVRTKIGSGVSNALIKEAAIGGFTTSWGALIVYIWLIGMTIAFLFAYVKRMLTVGFLIIISPLITITYSIDKMNDGKAQALNTWLREFLFNVFIQPFHCVIYVVFVSTSVDLLTSGASLAKMVLAILCMSFIRPAETIVKNIFGFNQASSLAEVIASVAVVKKIGDIATKSAGAASKTKFGKNISRSKAGRAMKAIGNTPPVKLIKNYGLPAGAAVAAASFEKGLNTSANAAQVGAEAYKAMNAFINGDQSADGSKQKIQLSENDLKKFANYISKNNNFNFDGYTHDQTKKNNLKAYAQTLIGANMTLLDDNIQSALRDLRTSNPIDYDITTNRGMQNFNNLQDMALDPNLDFNDPATNPLGHAWTNEEKEVVTAIQVRNFAQAVQEAEKQYDAGGYANPAQEIDDYIQDL